MTTPVRLQRYLAAAGVAARRKAEDLITAGRVTVNGEVVTTLGTKVDPDHDQVTVDGEAVVPLDYFYVLFNKPKGCITAVSDDRGRVTVMDYLPNLPVPVKPVGRLDFYTEGVLLLTNDGELAAKLLAPASHVPKTYHVKVHGHIEPELIKQLRKGVQLDDGTMTLPAEVEVLPAESKHTWLGITIHEGKHRQIHRMIESLGYSVDKLQRVAFANLTFHHLRVGDARELTQQELNELRDVVGLDHRATSRGRWKSKREETDIPRRARAKALAEEQAAADARAAGFSDAEVGRPGAGEDDREDTWEWQDGSSTRELDDIDREADRDADAESPSFGSRRGAGRDTGRPAGKASGGARGGARGGFGPRGAGAGKRGGGRGERAGRGGRDSFGPRGGGAGERGGSERAGRGSFGQRGTRGAAAGERGGRGGYGPRSASEREGGAGERGGRGIGSRSAGERAGRGGFGPRGGGAGERGGGERADRGGFGPRGGAGDRGRAGFGPRGGGAGERAGGFAGPRAVGERAARGPGAGYGAPRGKAQRPEQGGAKRGGQGRTFGKRVGPSSGGRRGPRR